MKIFKTPDEIARYLVRLKYQRFLADLADIGGHTMFIPGDTFEAEVTRLRKQIEGELKKKEKNPEYKLKIRY